MERRFLLVIVAMSLVGCATANIPNSLSRLESGQGILVTNIVTNAGGFRLILFKSTAFLPSARLAITQEGRSFRVLALPAGDYEWRRMTSADGRGEFYQRYNFKIEAGVINYVGDMYFEFESYGGFKVGVEDHSSEAWELFRESYPELSASYRFRTDLPKPLPPGPPEPFRNPCGY